MERSDGSLQNSGTLSVGGSLQVGSGNTIGPPSAGGTAPAGGNEPAASRLFALLTDIRVAAATADDLPSHLQAQLLGGAAEAQRRVTAGDVDGAAGVLLRARMAIDSVTAGSVAGATLRELVETALDLASSGSG